MIKISPENPDYHFRLGRSYSFLSNYNKAKSSYRTALEYKHSMPFTKIIEKVQRGFTLDTEAIHSKYVFIDGKNNLGAILHNYNGKKLFTKITKYTSKNIGAGREGNFYKRVCQDYPHLKDLVPQFVDLQIIDNVCYLTIEMIKSVPVRPTQNHFEKVIEFSNKVSTISYEDIYKRYELPNYVFQFKKGRAISVVHFFTNIHDENYNKKMFEAIELIMKQHKYPKAVCQLMKRLKSAIMDNALCNYIFPEQHYSLLHGDFAFQNVLIRKEDETPCIIDWTSFTLGPHFMDIARYFTSLLLPYSKVKDWYLEDGNSGKKLSNIEQIFFLYALILFYFQKLGRKDIETRLSDFILPALEDLEHAVMQFNLSREDKQLGNKVVEEMKEKDLKIQQLNNRIEVLEEERKYLLKRLDDVLTSKSWRITALLRRFTEDKLKK